MRKGSILIVEDSFVVATDLEDLLLSAGYHVLGPCMTLKEAFEQIENSPPDLALLDINVGGEQVFPVAEKLKSMEVPIFFISGHDTDAILPEMFRSESCLPKPIEHEALLNKVEAVISSLKTSAA